MIGSPQSIPKRFPVVLEDRILYWMQNSHCSNFNLIVKFKGNVDFELMKRALRLCLYAEPILGCRFVNRLWRQYWERLDDLESVEICTLVTKSEWEGDPARFLDTCTNINCHKGPQVRAYVLRDKSDILCLRINHVVADSGGLKDLAYRLSEIYNKLKTNPEYIPKPNLQGSRSLKQVFKHLGPLDCVKVVRRGIRDMLGFIRGHHHRKHPLPIRKPEGYELFLRVVEAKQFTVAKAYGEKRGATINDLMATSILRSFYNVVTPDPNANLRMVTTADLRRYIPGERAEAVCNLSGFSYINIGRRMLQDFDQLLKIVITEFTKLKQDYIGLGGIPFTAFVFKTMPFPIGLWIYDRLGNMQKKQAATTGDVALLFTNLGRVDPDRFRFDNTAISWAAVTTVRAKPPVLAVGISGFKDKLIISAGFCRNTISSSKVKCFLKEIAKNFAEIESIS